MPKAVMMLRNSERQTCKLEGCDRFPRNSGPDSPPQLNNRWKTTPRYCKEHKAADQNLKSKFGIGLLGYLAMYAEQGGRCKACGRRGLPAGEQTQAGARVSLVVDHCHDSGRVRGLLCWPCNVALGHLGESSERLLSLLAYLEEEQR